MHFILSTGRAVSIALWTLLLETQLILPCNAHDTGPRIVRLNLINQHLQTSVMQQWLKTNDRKQAQQVATATIVLGLRGTDQQDSHKLQLASRFTFFCPKVQAYRRFVRHLCERQCMLREVERVDIMFHYHHISP